jgi:hypothetical protein
MINVPLPTGGAAQTTPSKDKEKEKDGKGQASLLSFFGKPRSTPSKAPVVKEEEVEQEEEEEVYEESQRGITWWGESKQGSPLTWAKDQAGKRKIQEVELKPSPDSKKLKMTL